MHREVKRMIDRSFTEQKIRFQTEHKDGEQMDASRRYQELKERVMQWQIREKRCVM